MKKIKILGVSDTQWKESGNLLTRNGDYKLYYSSSNKLR